jgi:hypothetical protein
MYLLGLTRKAGTDAGESKMLNEVTGQITIGRNAKRKAIRGIGQFTGRIGYQYQTPRGYWRTPSEAEAATFVPDAPAPEAEPEVRVRLSDSEPQAAAYLGESFGMHEVRLTRTGMVCRVSSDRIIWA